MPLLLALTLAGTASLAVSGAEARWLPFYQAPPDEAAIRAAFGPPDQIDRTGEGEHELYYRRAHRHPAPRVPRTARRRDPIGDVRQHPFSTGLHAITVSWDRP